MPKGETVMQWCSNAEMRGEREEGRTGGAWDDGGKTGMMAAITPPRSNKTGSGKE
ncbi:MAG: hypothetical protein KAG97_05570 [Victivallales bacterium]|nr:hypothetical protein [Victivallales bacterium]